VNKNNILIKEWIKNNNTIIITNNNNKKSIRDSMIILTKIMALVLKETTEKLF